MASTYVNDLRLEEIADGEQSGTWGATTNTNLELIGDALGFGTEAITTNADTFTSTVADGAADAARAMYLKYTGTLDSACTITIAPDTLSRLQFIENATSGSQNIIISQGSGANVTITPGTTKAVYLDGAGSGAAVVDAFAHIAAVDLTVDDDLIVTDDASIGGALAVTGAITSSSGATITTTDNTAQLTLVSTDADASSGPQMTLYRNSASPADADFLGRIKFLGRNDNSQDFVGVDLLGRIIDASDGTEDSEFRISTIRAGTETTDFKITASGVSSVPEIVFNEDSADIDFRVEGSSVTDVIFVNAGDNDLHIGTGADLITDTAGTSNVRIGAAAGDSITSGGDKNVVIGDNAGTALTTGDANVAVGFEALATEDAHGNNTAVGYRALKDLNVGATGNNTAVGYNAGANITTGVQNTFIGGSSGDALTTASTNTGVGFESLTALTTGNSNVAIGYRALKTDTLGDRNVAVGNEALSTQNFSSSTDSYNVGVGYQAGGAITTGNTNTLIGGSSGDALTSADRNVAVGYNALSTETLGERNVAMGYGSLANQNNTSSTSPYNVAVGYNAGNDITTGSSNTLIGGLAGDALTTGVDNTAIGLAALGSETGGNYNVAVGKSTLVAQNQNGTGYNTAVGYEAGNDVTTGEQNTLIGALAGDALTDADYNTAIGQQALTSDTKGNRSTAIGRGALASQNFTSSTDANNTAVGFGAGNVLTDGCLNGTFIGYQAGLNNTGTKNTFIGASAGSEVTGGGSNVILGRYNGNQGGLDIRTLSNRIVLSDGDGNPRGIFDGDGTFLVGETSASDVTNGTGVYLAENGQIYGSSSSSHFLNKQADGDVLVFRQGGTTEGSVSISGTTTSYNGGHLSRWSQLTDNTRDNTLVKGTVMTNLDQMAEWTTDGVTEDNEQLNCMAISSVEGDANVAGVFVNWDNDDEVYTNDMNVAMTGDMVIRIAKGVTVARGDLLMSAGDGTAKPQGDDIVKSKTIAKVTSTNKSHTYDDGTYLVPCVLMAC